MLRLIYNKSTVAVRYNNDHVKDIINIPGPPEYIVLMQVFTTHSDRLNLPPLDTISQQLSFAWKELKRRINLLLGCPGSPNAATLNSMLTLLRSETESQLSISATTVGIAFANAALESREGVDDALSYAGLKKLGKWQVPNRELYWSVCGPSYTDPINVRKGKLPLEREYGTTSRLYQQDAIGRQRKIDFNDTIDIYDDEVCGLEARKG